MKSGQALSKEQVLMNAATEGRVKEVEKLLKDDDGTLLNHRDFRY